MISLGKWQWVTEGFSLLEPPVPPHLEPEVVILENNSPDTDQIDPGTGLWFIEMAMAMSNRRRCPISWLFSLSIQ